MRNRWPIFISVLSKMELYNLKKSNKDLKMHVKQLVSIIAVISIGAMCF